MKITIQGTLLLAAVWLCAQVLFGCAHAPPPEEKKAEAKAVATAPSIEAQQVAAEEEAPYVTEVKFHKKNATLAPRDGEEIKKMLAKAEASGSVQEVKVISWGDEEYPSVHTKKLSASQRKLADRRGLQIKDYIHSLNDKVEVTNYNMTERPNVLADMVSTSNARIKKALEVAGIPNTDSSVKKPAKASRSIVMVVMKDK